MSEPPRPALGAAVRSLSEPRAREASAVAREAVSREAVGSREAARTRTDEEVNREQTNNLLSSSVPKPNFENFEAEFNTNRQKINDKYGVLMKEEQKIRAEIEGFNREMKVLLELKDIHKQPPNLSNIKLEKLGPGDVYIHDLPMSKAEAYLVAPGQQAGQPVVPTRADGTYTGASQGVQYFARLICDSDQCKGRSQIMAIHQFGLNNELVDEHALKEDGSVKSAGAARSTAQYHKVDYITSNSDLAEAKKNLQFIQETLKRVEA